MVVALRRIAIVAMSLTVSAGLAGGVVARQPYLADIDPHEGVARAHAMPVQGIDVSNWQGDIDWDKVRAAGTQFAFIKATEGKDMVDPRFSEYWQEARAAGIPHAPYHFYYFCSTPDEQADWFIRNVPKEAMKLPPVLDVEWNNESQTCRFRPDPATVRAQLRVVPMIIVPTAQARLASSPFTQSPPEHSVKYTSLSGYALCTAVCAATSPA